LLPETAKKPAEPFVNVKLHGITVFDASRAVSTPTVVPGIALLFMDKLLMLIVIRLSACALKQVNRVDQSFRWC
jgi:hypothetical protein